MDDIKDKKKEPFNEDDIKEENKRDKELEEAKRYVEALLKVEELNEESEPDDSMPVIPLRGITIFPSMVLHFDIGREKSISALEKAMMMNQTVFLATQKNADLDLPTREDFYKIGTIAKIKQMLKLPGDTIRVLVEGISRGEIVEYLSDVPYFKCRINVIEETEYDEIPVTIEALMRIVLASFEEYLIENPRMSEDILPSVETVKQPGRLADIITSNLDIKVEEKQEVLETIQIEDRLSLLSAILSREIEILNIEHTIHNKVRTKINRNQKEYYLREQMRVIQEELGEDEDVDEEIYAWLRTLKRLKLPEPTRKKVEKEIKRFKKIQPQSAEGTVIRTYIEWILALPWNKATKDNLDLKVAEDILNEDHYGLDKVKERILEYLAVAKLSNGLKGPILCLVGPPGTGKTSVAKSVARAMDRKFVRVSLGGVRDEAEIRGHRRTYIGAIPGRIMTAIKESEVNNPVFLFDEVDKIGNDFRGDPASALLEVLDPEQNKEFTDHYLEIPFDLSKVLFITTANTTDTIPRPLLDRMEVIEVSGYTEEEKVNIAKTYLIPKKLKEHGLKEGELIISESGIREIINSYTRESGVRNLEREIANIARKAARRFVEQKRSNIRVTAGNIEKYLGKKRYFYDKIEGENEVGVTTGLAWTSVGGETLSIETSVLPGTGNLVLTGQLGDVMQESAKTGFSYIRSRAKTFKLEDDFHKNNDLHIHIPEGATPKDGPSAGVTMCTSMVSALTGYPVKKDLAMTGEITLRGKVLPVGGIREKVLAANRAGISKVLLPKENQADIDEIPSNVRRKLDFVLIENVDEALQEALVKETDDSQ